MDLRGSISSAPRRIPWWGSALLGAAVVVVLAAPVASRFGQGGGRYFGWYTTAEDHLYTGLILDQIQYLRLVDATAGNAPSSEVAPFTARALAPWLAGHLPLDAYLALTLVNISCLVLGTFALARLVMDLTRRRDAVALAVAVWAVSFPVFKYTGNGFVDPAAIGLIPVVLLFIWRRWLIAALGVFFAAMWMKETSLVLAAVGIAFVWKDPQANRRRRWFSTVAWLCVAGFAYATADLPGGPHQIVFAPWVPHSLTTVRDTLSFNLLLLPRLIAFGATVAPAFFGVAMWWRGRRSGSPVLAAPDAVPLVVGCIGGAAIGLSALPTALFDGRSAWTTLPFAVLLIAGWWASNDRTTAGAEMRGLLRTVRWPVLGVVMVWFALVALVSLPGAPNALEDDYQPRFTSVPTAPENRTVYSLSGKGTSTVEVPGEGPVLLRFEGEAPVGLTSGGLELVSPGRVESGLTMFDPGSARGDDVDRLLEVDSEGSWSVEVQPVSSALFFAMAPLSGSGPSVVAYPGGLPRAIQIGWSSDDPTDRVLLVGGCQLGTCGEVGPDGVVPAGTEALVIDASGRWDISPSEWASEMDQPVLADTDATVVRPSG